MQAPQLALRSLDRSGWLPALVLSAWLVGCVSGQQVIGWGSFAFDQDAYDLPVVAISASSPEDWFLVLTSDGRARPLARQRPSLGMPPIPPAGNPFVVIDAGAGTGRMQDGTTVKWTLENLFVTVTPPPLPPGTSWIDFCGSDSFTCGLRSDGQIIMWWEAVPLWDPMPLLTPDLSYTSISCGGGFGVMAALVSDGTIRVGGNLLWPAVSSVPALPIGTIYTKVESGFGHIIALRSDGVVVSWGDNQFGQTDVPTLPPGVTFVDVNVGADFSFARRSDGLWEAWGKNSSGQCDIPSLPTGVTFVDVRGARWSAIGLRSDARIETWGSFGPGTPLSSAASNRDVVAIGRGCIVQRSDGSTLALPNGIYGGAFPQFPPVLPQGEEFVALDSGLDFMLGLVSDGTIRAWGLNYSGQLNLPALPSGMSYTEVRAGGQRSVAMRSDGQWVAWGDNAFGQSNIPPLPPGMRYVDIAPGPENSLMLRSDGALLVAGTGGSGVANVPAIPAGLRVTQLACGWGVAAALLSDGSLLKWGGYYGGYSYVQVLPPGVRYVDVVCGETQVIARRSDGEVWASGVGIPPIPPIAPGESYLSIDANWIWSAGLVGSRSIYVREGPGCGGSLPVGELVPRDTPQIGRSLPITLRHLPMDTALLLVGWQPIPGGLSLSSLGMTGCSLSTSIDASVPVVGAGGEASLTFAIPYDPRLLGVEFYHQAAILDLGVNAFGFVLSEAMHGVVGG